MFKTCLISALMLLAASSYALAQPAEIPAGSQCHACGMKVDAKSEFSAQAVDKDGRAIAFCDIGDLLVSYMKLKDTATGFYVKDYSTGQWTDALSASYVISEKFKTPMMWGIAAFKNKEDAQKSGAPMTFEEAREAIKAQPAMKKKMH